MVCAMGSAVSRCCGELLGSGRGEEVCGVGAVGEVRPPGVDADGGELPVVAFCCDASGSVGVGGDDHIRPSGEQGCLLGRQGGAEWRESGMPATGGEGDGDGVHGAFDDDRGSADC